MGNLELEIPLFPDLPQKVKILFTFWCLYRHQCDLPERFGKKRPMNRKFDQCVSKKNIMS